MQLPLALPCPRTWGGRRAGAGRKPTRRGTHVPHVERPFHAREVPIHATLRIVPGVRLRDLPVAAAVGESLRALVGGEREERFRVVAFSMQSDHAHLIVEASDRVALQNGMRAVSIRIAKAVNRALGRRGRVVQERYHAHALATPTEARNALLYVLRNGEKHGEPAHEFVAGLDTRSSARWNLGRDRVAPPVSAPRTYFMRAGWKKAPVRRQRHAARKKPRGRATACRESSAASPRAAHAPALSRRR